MPAAPLLLAFLLIGLSACSGRPLVQVRGEARGWTAGPGTVEFLSDDLQTLSATDLDRVGRFILKLPDAQTLAPLLQTSLVPEVPAACTSTVQASSGARYYTLGDVTAYPSSGEKNAYTLVSEDRAGSDPVRVTRRLFVYASEPVRLTGQLSCPVAAGQNLQATATYGLTLKAGWNRALSSQTVYGSGASQSVLSVTGEDGFDRWTVAP